MELGITPSEKETILGHLSKLQGAEFEAAVARISHNYAEQGLTREVLLTLWYEHCGQQHPYEQLGEQNSAA